MGTVNIPALLEGILEATAAEAAAKARITTLRATLEAEGRRRLAVEGAAPSWHAPQLGKVRLDPATPWAASVADEAAFGSYVAEHHPTEATALITIPAADLPDALQALEFVQVPVAESRVEVRSAWSGPFLSGLAVDVTEERDASAQVTRTVVAADTATGNIVPGIGVTRSEAKLVVSLDRARRTAAITEARSTADALIAVATDDDEAPEVDAVELDRRRVELEGMHADTLGVIAKGLGLGSSGTKAALAERIARIELATGHTIRPAATLPERPAADVVLGLVESGLTIGDALVVYATRDGGHTTADVELDRARRDVSAGHITDERIIRLLGDTHYTPTEGRIVEQLRELGPHGNATTVSLEEALAMQDPALASSPLPEGTEVEEVSTVPLDHPVEEVPDAGDVADALEAERQSDDPRERSAVAALDRLRANLDGLSREVLRQHAKTLPGVSAAGTKADVIDRLVAAGVTVSAVNETARKVRA